MSAILEPSDGRNSVLTVPPAEWAVDAVGSGGGAVGDTSGHPVARRVRKRLRRFDGQVHMDRWGFELERVGGVFVHRLTAPDPSLDLHDHPWWFASLVLVGGYREQRALCRDAPLLAELADSPGGGGERGVAGHRACGSLKVMRLDECHRIVRLDGRACWTLVVHGPHRRRWGFYLPAGFLSERVYDLVVRSSRHDLWDEVPA